MKLLIVFLLCIIALLVIIIFNLYKKLNFFKLMIRNNSNSFLGSDLFDNITRSKNLYRDLLAEIHPDKYVNDNKCKDFASQLSFKIGDSKNSYKDLVSLGKIANSQLTLSAKFLKKYPEINNND